VLDLLTDELLAVLLELLVTATLDEDTTLELELLTDELLGKTPPL
jgi:hypothetical protein